MKLRRLDRSGHTEVITDINDIIAETEKMMNEVGGAKRCSVLLEEPGQKAVRVDDLTTLPTKDPESTVYVLPQLVGG
jgi:hypothetical protein